MATPSPPPGSLAPAGGPARSAATLVAGAGAGAVRRGRDGGFIPIVDRVGARRHVVVAAGTLRGLGQP